MSAQHRGQGAGGQAVQPLALASAEAAVKIAPRFRGSATVAAMLRSSSWQPSTDTAPTRSHVGTKPPSSPTLKTWNRWSDWHRHGGIWYPRCHPRLRYHSGSPPLVPRHRRYVAWVRLSQSGVRVGALSARAGRLLPGPAAGRVAAARLTGRSRIPAPTPGPVDHAARSNHSMLAVSGLSARTRSGASRAPPPRDPDITSEAPHSGARPGPLRGHLHIVPVRTAEPLSDLGSTLVRTPCATTGPAPHSKLPHESR